MNNKYETVEICEENYKRPGIIDPTTEEVDCEELFDDVKTLVRILLKNGYQMRIWNDGLTTAIQYNYRDESMTGVSLEWLGEDEYVGAYEKEEPEDK